MPMKASMPGKGVRSQMVSRTIDAAFVERVRRGEYEVDAHAVAEAMARSWAQPDTAGSAGQSAVRSHVLVPAQTVDGPAVRADDGKPEAGRDLA
jgi:hypothetical protein